MPRCGDEETFVGGGDSPDGCVAVFRRAVGARWNGWWRPWRRRGCKRRRWRRSARRRWSATRRRWWRIARHECRACSVAWKHAVNVTSLSQSAQWWQRRGKSAWGWESSVDGKLAQAWYSTGGHTTTEWRRCGRKSSRNWQPGKPPRGGRASVARRSAEVPGNTKLWRAHADSFAPGNWLCRRRAGGWRCSRVSA